MAKIFLVIALACSIGLHWVALQSLAWTSMLAGNLVRESLRQSVLETFDGQHPCQLCKAIEDGKKSEKKGESAPLAKSLEFPPATEDFVLTSPARYLLPGAPQMFALLKFQTPPTPPPRFLLA